MLSKIAYCLNKYLITLKMIKHLQQKAFVTEDLKIR